MSYLCPKCVLDDAEEMAKYDWAFKKGRIRPKLLHITLTLLLCPRCKTQYIANAFFLEEKFINVFSP